MVKLTLLAGGYTSFIASYVFDTVDHSLKYLDRYPTGENPTWITSHPKNQSILYATNEKTADTYGSVQSFTVGHDGALTLVDTTESGGRAPSYVGRLPSGQVVVTNYATGTVRFIPTEHDHLHFSDNAGVWAFPLFPTTGTQNGSEPHMVYQNGNETLIPDKGNDRIWRMGPVEEHFPNDSVVHGAILHPTGTGPRHIRVRDGLLYTLHELSNTLTVQKFPEYPNGQSDILANASIVPTDAPQGAVFAAAEILIPRPTAEYPTQFVYVSNRNVGTPDKRGDTIAIFEYVHANATLVLRKQVYTGLSQVRGMMSGETAGPDGVPYIVAAGAAGGGVKVFERTDKGADLEEVAVDEVVSTRTTFVWLRPETNGTTAV